jgi:hypothetical protein
MKIIFDHKNGIFTEEGNSLLEVFAITDKESSQEMFESGWLPFRNRWYQTVSSRIKLGPISSRRKKELQKLNIGQKGDINKLIEQSKMYKKFDESYLKEYLKLNHFKFWFDSCFCGIVNMVDDIPYYTFMIWDESQKKHSYGTLSFYYLMEYLYESGYEYLYTSEYYPQFRYKKNLPNFEWWNGTDWIKENKTKNISSQLLVNIN